MSPKWLSDIFNTTGPPKAKIELNEQKLSFVLWEMLLAELKFVQMKSLM